VTDDEGQIRRLIARFANSFDLKAWDSVERRRSDRPRGGAKDVTAAGGRVSA